MFVSNALTGDPVSDPCTDIPPGFEPLPPFGPFHELTGPFHVRETPEGHVIGLRMAEKHRNLSPGMHGGMVCMLIDTAFTWACKYSRQPTLKVLTTQLSVSFVGSAEVGDWVEARTDIVRSGRRIVFANCFVWCRDRRIAQASTQFQVMDPQPR